MSSTSAETQTTQIYQLFIKAPPEAVWQAITDPTFIGRYFYGGRFEVANGRIRSFGPDGAAWGDNEILEQDPPRRLVHTWRSLYNPDVVDEPESRVSWEIDGRDGGISLLTVTHDRLEGAPGTAAQVAGEGWMFVLSGLKSVLETGASLTE